MRWEKQRFIYAPNRRHFWNQSHAQLPVVDVTTGEIWRIYYATRDASSHSFTSFIDVAAGQPERVLFESERPVLPFGKLGAFDEHGIMPACVVSVGAEKYLYYVGWSQKRSVPFQNAIGLAISRDGGVTFEKYSDGPLLGANVVDPYFTGTICVLPDGGFYRAYYLSCVEWTVVAGRPEPAYVLKYAESQDGIRWDRSGHIAIAFKDDDEGGLVSAAVIKLDGRYRMWFGYRKRLEYRERSDAAYRIGYAESVDGVNWSREDAASGIEPSDAGWDSEMISYPYVLPVGRKVYMFYNGNGFGRTGFGYAVLSMNE
jgi:hypothetical protein